MNESEIKGILEALLMSSNDPLNLEQLQAIVTEPFDSCSEKELATPNPSQTAGTPSREQLQTALAQLAQDYENRAIELKQLANGYVLQTKKYYSPWVSRLSTEKPVKYSRALLETLAIIAYRQPVTRADIEEIRGVAVASSMLKTLLEREWIRIAGHRDVPGKPAVYITTKIFLSYFNLTSLKELPPLQLS